MSTQTTGTAVTETIVVDAPVERAFAVYTQEMGTWWPKDHHILQGELADMVVEPRAGGRIYDRGVDGSICRWARVLAYEPPHRFVFSWDITTAWQIETDPAKTSEVEVRFVAETPSRTRVELEHRHLDRHGADWEQMREAVASPDGWRAGLTAFAAMSSTAASNAARLACEGAR
jgi:uncharacterized protein YndB with AHSA1/START domain